MKKLWRGAVGVLGIAALVGAAFILLPTDATDVGAQKVVEGECDRTQVIDSYDFEGTVWEIEDGKQLSPLQYQVRVSGKDFHTIRYVADGSYRYWAISLGGVAYERGPSSDEWLVLDTKFSDITGAINGIGSNPLCPDPSKFRFVSKETLPDGETLRRYTDWPESGKFPELQSPMEVYGGHGLVRRSQHEIVVDSKGHLRKLLMESQIWGTWEGGEQRNTFRYEETYSGFGEPNVITAPVVSGQ